MLEGIQQTYPGVGGGYPQVGQQTGYNNPLGGVMGSGVQGLLGQGVGQGVFGNVGIGRPIDPITQSYLQQAQLAQQTGGQQGIGMFGRPYDPITAAYLHQVAQQAQLAHLFGQNVFGNAGVPHLTNPIFQGFNPLGGQIGGLGINPLHALQTLGQIGRPVPYLDPLTIGLLQQAQFAQQLQNIPQMGYPTQHFGGGPWGSPLSRFPVPSQFGAGNVSPLGAWA